VIAVTLDSRMDWLQHREAVLCLRLLAAHDALWDDPWASQSDVDEVLAKLDRLRLAVVRRNRYYRERRAS
jgi:hypothetical protein